MRGAAYTGRHMRREYLEFLLTRLMRGAALMTI